MKKDNELNQQLLYIVIGGELVCVILDNCEFKDLEEVDFVGVFGIYEEVCVVWKGVVQCIVDNVYMWYFIIYVYKLFELQISKQFDVLSEQGCILIGVLGKCLWWDWVWK